MLHDTSPTLDVVKTEGNFIRGVGLYMQVADHTIYW